MSSQDRAKKNNKKKRKKEKYKNKNLLHLLYLLCLISNIMPQLEQSSLQPSTYLQHRHLLQTTSYNHLLRLQLLISRERIHKQKQARNPPLDGGLRSQKGLRPFNPLQNIDLHVGYSVLSYDGRYCMTTSDQRQH